MNLLFFDTNFLFYSRSRFNSTIVKKLKDSNFAIFTSELVIIEGKNKNFREISDLYYKYKTFMNNEKLKMYVDLNDHTEFNESKIIEENNKNIDAYIAEYFGDNVISSIEDSQIGKILFERYQFKKPPFINGENSSDKGWKDTLIWVSFMNFCVGKEYDCFYFISKDNGFINQQDILKDEFNNTVGKPIIFINPDSFDDLFLSLKITKIEKKNTNQIPDDVREEIMSSIDAFVEFDEPYNAFGDTKKADAFAFFEKPTLEDIEKFCYSLGENEPSFVFMRAIDLSDIVSKHFFLATTRCLFNISNIRSFLKSWNLILKDYPDYKDYFLKALESKFIKTIRSANQKSEFDNLPF